jgi:hypothetical protein
MLDEDLIRITGNNWIRFPDPDLHQTEKKKKGKHSSRGSLLEMTRLTIESWRLRIRFKMKARIRN